MSRWTMPKRAASHRQGRLADIIPCACQWQRSLTLNQLLQGFAADEFHHHVWLAVGVAEAIDARATLG